jgi:hypothetical protein
MPENLPPHFPSLNTKVDLGTPSDFAVGPPDAGTPAIGQAHRLGAADLVTSPLDSPPEPPPDPQDTVQFKAVGIGGPPPPKSGRPSSLSKTRIRELRGYTQTWAQAKPELMEEDMRTQATIYVYSLLTEDEKAVRGQSNWKDREIPKTLARTIREEIVNPVINPRFRPEETLNPGRKHFRTIPV